jgi:hypothetical protein
VRPSSAACDWQRTHRVIEVFRQLQVLRHLESAPGDHEVGWGDESDGMWTPLLVPWDAEVELTPDSLLAALGAHAQIRATIRLRNVQDDEDDDDDWETMPWRSGRRDWERKRWREASEAAGSVAAGALDYRLTPHFKIGLREFVASQQRIAVFLAGSDQLNPLPTFAVARVRPDLVAGFIGGIVHT